MKKYDVIVIGAGSGLNISSAAASMGKKVAVVEKGPMGGTCLNRGCIPSKIVIHSADVANTINNSEKFGIRSKITKIDFGKITTRASRIVDADSRKIEQANKANKNIDLYKVEAKFVGKKKLQVGNKIITANKIVLAAGTRPIVPPIEGLRDVDYITSKEALRLKKQPKTLTIIGGGYISVEMANFFSSLGTNVNIIEYGDGLIKYEDAEISNKFTEIFSKKCNLYLSHGASKVTKAKGKFFVEAKHVKSGKVKKIVSDQLLVAVGRRPNSDILNVAATGVKTNKRGFVQTNKYLETNVKGIYALGDLAGNWLFKHSANLEANYVFNNAILNKKVKADYTAMPHAIFTSPQVAGVGMNEAQLQEKKIKYIVGKHYYIHTGMGTALQDNDGFVKIMVDKKSRKILGCFILGTGASTLIHEVIVAMKNNVSADKLAQTVHVHPALSEVVQRAVRGL